jgi:hypothetical protein
MIRISRTTRDFLGTICMIIALVVACYAVTVIPPEPRIYASPKPASPKD